MVWNIYNYFITYANLDGFDPKTETGKLTILDEWILARLNQTINSVTLSLDTFDALVLHMPWRIL